LLFPSFSPSYCDLHLRLTVTTVSHCIAKGDAVRLKATAGTNATYDLGKDTS